MKVKIYTYADKRPDFIPWQHKSFKHFVKDDYEFIVFNNAVRSSDSEQIESTCKTLGIKTIKVQWPLVSGAKRVFKKYAALACAHPINWSFHEYMTKDHDTINVIIDSDMFFIAPFSFNEYLKGYDIAAVKQIRKDINYLWNGIMLFNMQTLPDKEHMNFMNGKVEGIVTDVGGNLYYWLHKNPDIRLRNFLHTGKICTEHKNMQCLPEEIRNRYDQDFLFEIYEHVILHYGRGSNWDTNPEDYHRRKSELAFYFVEEAMKGNIVLPDYDFVLDPDIWKSKRESFT